MLGDFFPQPLPKSFNGIEVWTVARQPDQFNPKPLSFCLNKLTAMIGGAIPNNNELLVSFIEPLHQALQKLNRVVTITATFIPNETAALTEIIGTIPIDPLGQSWRMTNPPSRLTRGSPGIATSQVLMDMGFVDIDQKQFFPTHSLKKALKLLNKLSPFVRISLG